jgi:ATP-dependent exoDNAse (exonuclease V) beta subunit
LNRRFDPATGELRAALPAGYGIPQVKVTLDEPPPPGKPSAKKTRPALSALVDQAVELAGQGGGRIASQIGPIPVDRKARRQYSFSRLTGAVGAHPPVSRISGAVEAEETPEPQIDPLGLGTLVHDVLGEIDFDQPGDVARLVRRFGPRHLPEGEDALAEASEMLGRFLESLRARAIAESGQAHRELEFLLAWPPGAREPEPRYLQGFIDCLYQDAAGRWVVLDYKTNRVTESTVEEVAAEYEMQMLLYALAVEQIFESAPAELLLLFLRPGVEYRFAWDAAARERVVELVNQALAACVES